MDIEPVHDRSSADQIRFRTTRWSLVSAAAKGAVTDSPDESTADEALQQLCQTYWYPVYSFIRRGGASRDQAEDLAQGFFALLLEKDFLADADRQRGRFRTFLLAAVKNFLSHDRERAATLKRGGAVRHWSLDFDRAEARYAIEPVDGWSAEAIYDRNWALSLLAEVLAGLEQEYTKAGKAELFDALSPHLTGGTKEETFADVAERIGTTAGAVKVAAHRLRSAYRKQLVAAVGATLEAVEDVDAERRILMDAISGATKHK